MWEILPQNVYFPIENCNSELGVFWGVKKNRKLFLVFKILVFYSFYDFKSVSVATLVKQSKGAKDFMADVTRWWKDIKWWQCVDLKEVFVANSELQARIHMF